MLAQAAKKLEIKTVILSDDKDAPSKNFSDIFIFGNYDDDKIIEQFIDSVDVVTFEFENIPYSILKTIEQKKKYYQIQRLIN